MGKLIFKHGVMESGKTAELLMKAHLFKGKGKEVVLLRPSTDSRSRPDLIESRVVPSAACVTLAPDDLPSAHLSKCEVILVDEAQFLQESQVEDLADYADTHGVLIMAYGLRVDFFGRLFRGTKRFMELADRIDEMPSMCECGKKATMHYLEKAPQDTNVLCGDTNIYKCLCRKCFKQYSEK